MERFERVTAMKVMQLRSQETLSGKKEFIVTACTAVFGEDISTKGKVCMCVWVGRRNQLMACLHWCFKLDPIWIESSSILSALNPGHVEVV